MTVEQTDILGDEQLAEIQQSLSRVTLPFEVNNLYFKNVPALLAHVAGLQAQLDEMKVSLSDADELHVLTVEARIAADHRHREAEKECDELRARLAEVEQERDELRLVVVDVSDEPDSSSPVTATKKHRVIGKNAVEQFRRQAIEAVLALSVLDRTGAQVQKEAVTLLETLKIEEGEKGMAETDDDVEWSHDVRCEACEKGYRFSSDGLHYNPTMNDATWGACRKLVAYLQRYPTRATAAAPLDAPFQLPVQVHRNTPYFEIWAGTSRIAKFNEASGKAREIAEYIAARLNTTTTPTQPETPSLTALQWAYNEGIDAAKNVIRSESFDDDDTADYIVPCLINAIARKTNPYAFKSIAPEPPDPAAEAVAKDAVRAWINRDPNGQPYAEVVRAITAALQARDERAARIAEDDANQRQPYDYIGQQTGFRIARKIRSKEQPDGK